MTKEKETSKAMDKKISKKFTYKMDLYTLIEKLKDIQAKCENEGKGVEVVIENNIVFLDVKE